jgi:hypothetical protein
MTFTPEENSLIKQGLDDAINRLTTPGWKRRARAAALSFEAGTATKKELAEALAPVAPSRECWDSGKRPPDFHFNLRKLVTRFAASH